MPATRTQIYLTERQRAMLDEISRRENRPLAAIVRDAVDAYLEQEGDFDQAVTATFGALPGLLVPPRDEWDRA